MDQTDLNLSMSFLEDCLNNSSSIIKHDEFKNALLNLHLQLFQADKKLKLKIRPLGTLCVNCQKYISSTNLVNSLKLDNQSYICSLNCLQELKNIQTSRSRKSTKDSITNDEETEENPSKKCLIS